MRSGPSKATYRVWLRTRLGYAKTRSSYFHNKRTNGPGRGGPIDAGQTVPVNYQRAAGDRKRGNRLLSKADWLHTRVLQRKPRARSAAGIRPSFQSLSQAGLCARIEYPKVPNSRALSSPPAPAKVSRGLASSTSTSPAPVITVSHPAHGRAPAIQPVQRSMSRSASSGTGRSRQISATVIRPPGFSTRKIWR